jgi:hypothetical protein
MGKGGGGSQPQTTTAYQTNLPEYAKPYVENMLNAAQAQVYTPDMKGFREYKPYSTDPTQYFAGPTGLQQGVYGEAAGMRTPGGFAPAQGLTGLAAMGQMGAGQQYARQATDPFAMQSYMSPYMQNVVDTQKTAALRDFQVAQPMRQAQQTLRGAFGGSRSAIENAEAQRNLMSQLQGIQATGTQSAFEKAQQAQQFGANLGLQGLAGAAQSAGQLGQLAGGQQQADLARLGFQQQTGQQQQQYQQGIINQAIQDYATQQQYPMIQLANMSALLRGLPLQSGTTQMYQAAPSVTSQIAGLGTAGVGAYGLGKATGIFKEGGQVKGYKYGGAIDDDKLRSMAETLSVDQLEAQLRDPTLDTDERQIFADALRNKQPTPGLGALRAPVFAASGGIVAFQEGDLVEDDDSSAYAGYTGEDDDDELIDSVLAAGVPAGAYGYASRGLGGMQAGENAGVGINPNAPSGSGIRADAKAPRGIEALTQYVLAKESGGRRYDKSGNILTSSKGAEGEMQVMPMTQRDPGFGVKAARDNSPEEKARVGRDYLAALYNKYGDEKLAAIAYNMGPGATDKWLRAGADVNKLPKETRGYIAQLAGGGAVKHFVGGGTMEGFGEVEREEEVTYDPYFAEGMFSGYTKKAPISAVGTTVDPKTVIKKTSAPKQAPVATPAAPAASDENAAQKELDARAAYEAQLAKEQKDMEEGASGTSKLEDIFLRKEKNLEKQGAIDANLGLIMAGLGAAGGTSRNALENIAKGAQLGVGTYMTGAKQRAAGENALMSGRLGLEKVRGLQDIRKSQMDQNLSAKIGSQIGAREKQIEQFAYNTIAGKGSMVMDSAEAQAAIAKEVQRLKSQDPLLGKLYSQYGLPPIQSAGGPAILTKEQLLAKAAAEKKRLGI